MRARRITTWHVAFFLWAALVGSTLFAQDAAEWVPQETKTYIQVNHASELAEKMVQDPRLGALFDPAWRSEEAEALLGELEGKLGLTRREFLVRYFGERLVLASLGDEEDVVCVSAVSAGDAEQAVAKLGLTKQKDLGAFAVYPMDEGRAWVAFGQGAMVLGKAGSAYFERVVQVVGGGGAKLAGEPRFLEWSKRLPGESAAFLYHRDETADETHVVAVRYSGGDLVLDYAGDSASMRELLSRRSDAGPTEYGPVPAGAILGVSLNAVGLEEHSRLMEALDNLLAPRSVSADILPKLGSPWVVAVAEVEVKEGASKPGEGSIPAVLVAVKMRDASVAAELDGLLAKFIEAVNARLSIQGLGEVQSESVGEGADAYHVADLGELVTTLTQQAELGRLFRLTYGRAGDWYLVCTQEEMFLQCREVAGGGGASWVSGSGFARGSLGEREGWIAAAALNGTRAAHYFESLGAGVAFGTRSEGDARAIGYICELLKQTRVVSVEVWGEEAAVRARVQLTSQPAAVQ